MEGAHLVEKLVELCAAAVADPAVDIADIKAARSAAALYDFAHGRGREQHPLIADALAAIEVDPAFVKAREAGGAFTVMPRIGGSVKVDAEWLFAFLWRALQQPQDAWPDEAKLFIPVATFSASDVPATIKDALLGFRLPDDQPVELAIGWLRPSNRYELSIPGLEHTREERGVVYTYIRELPMRLSGWERPETVFTDEEYADYFRSEEQYLVRALLALALGTEAPVREYSTWRDPFYVPSALGRVDEAAGVLVIVGDAEPPTLTQDEIAATQEWAERLRDVDVSLLGVPVRRYLQARSERARKVDMIIDFGVALEALSGVADKGKGPTQGKVIARLITDDAEEQIRLFQEDLKQFRGCREAILHRGELPAEIPDVARLGERLVRDALIGRIDGRS